GSQERMLSFSFSGKVKDDDLAVLKDLVPFDILVLDDTKITDAGLKHLKDLPSLRSLSLSDCVKVTDAGLKEISGLQELESLNLGTTSITDAGLKHLQSLTALRRLDLSSTSVKGPGM